MFLAFYGAGVGHGDTGPGFGMEAGGVRDVATLRVYSSLGGLARRAYIADTCVVSGMDVEAA